MPKNSTKGAVLAILALIVVVGVVARVLVSFRNDSAEPEEGKQSVRSVRDGFRESARDAGIHFRMGFLPGEQGENFKVNLYDHGCGVAVGDYDGDGHEDLYFVNQIGGNALYRNKGDGTFEDVTQQMAVALDDRISVGATFADYDNDGDQDLFVTSTRGGNVLFRNDAGSPRRFTDVTDAAGLKHVGHSQMAFFFDYDNDGLLDLYVVQTADWTTNVYNETQRYYEGKGLEGVITSPKEFNTLYHNNGDSTFTDVTTKANLQGRGWSGDVAVFDYDEDGWMDVLVTCMFGPAQLYRNLQNGTFQDVTKDVLGRTPFGGVGAKVFDFNNDGKLDICIVDMHSDMWMGVDIGQKSLEQVIESEKIRFDYFFGPKVEGSAQFEEMEQELETTLGFHHDEVVFGNAFYKALDGGKYDEVSRESNMETFWPWGVVAADFDNDGFEDVFMTSGMGYPFYYWRNYLLMNDGHDSFIDKSLALGVEPPPRGKFLREKIKGVKCVRSSRGLATADFDGDGRVEVVTNNFNDEPYLFKNELPKRNYIALRLRGTRSNRDAVGAIVRVTAGNKMMVRQVHAAGGYLSQSSQTVHFGLGDQSQVDRVEVIWPRGERQILNDLEINRLAEIIEPSRDAISLMRQGRKPNWETATAWSAPVGRFSTRAQTARIK